MAKNRYINTKMWSDNYFSDLDPIEKLLFIYILTNERTNICGVYELPIKIMSIETGIEKEMIEKIFKRFEKEDKIKYSNGWIAIKNFIKHQDQGSPKVKIGIDSELKKVPQEMIEYLYPIYTLSDINININTNTNTNINTNNINTSLFGDESPHKDRSSKKPEKSKEPKKDKNKKTVWLNISGKDYYAEDFKDTFEMFIDQFNDGIPYVVTNYALFNKSLKTVALNIMDLCPFYENILHTFASVMMATRDDIYFKNNLVKPETMAYRINELRSLVFKNPKKYRVG